MANIKGAVMRAVEEKIKKAQAECDAEVANLKLEKKESSKRAWTTLFKELDRITAIFYTKKNETVNRHVNSILSKFI